MDCPVCKTVPLQTHQLDEGLVTHSCPQCSGQYLRSERYFQWLQRHGENLPEKSPDLALHLPVHDSKPGKLCPECGAFLIRHKVGHGMEFHIDRCGRCGGIWLDENEWDVLKSHGLHDDMHHVFSQAWQAEVKGQERQQHYREVVMHILDDKLLQLCSGEDLAKLKEFKAWLDGHPNRRELYAYLGGTRDL
jgi:Zn-finger nucleic acid-binding protein